MSKMVEYKNRIIVCEKALFTFMGYKLEVLRMIKRPNYDDLAGFKTPTQRRNEAQITMVQRDMKRIDDALANGGEAEIKALHIDLDGTYQNLIRNWSRSLWGYFADFGFNYELLGESSLRDNLTTIRGKLRGYLLQLSPNAADILLTESSSMQNKNTSTITTENASDNPEARANMYDIIRWRKFDAVQEYTRIWTLFNTADRVGPRAVSLAEQIHSCMQFFPNSFKRRAITLDDFNDIFGFKFNPPNESVTEDELISYCEYIVTLCDHLWVYSEDCLEEDSDDLRDDLFETIESCMDELGLMPAKRDNITIFVNKDPTVTTVAELVGESLSYDVKSYIHKQMKGNLQQKKTILKFLADDIEPQRKILNNINKTLSGDLFQMLQKFVRHNNEDNPYIKGLSPKELEDCYDDIYQMWLLAKLEIDNLDRKKKVEAVLQKVNG